MENVVSNWTVYFINWGVVIWINYDKHKTEKATRG